MAARLILADDHPLVRQGLRDMIARTADMVVVTEAADGAAAEGLARSQRADLLILDIAMPLKNGLRVLEALRADGIALPVLFFTMAPADQYAAYARRAGAQGYLGKETETDELLKGLRRILAGHSCFPALAPEPPISPLPLPAGGVLSERERQVLQGLLQGTSQVDIAAQLGISAASANTYRRRILEKFGVSNNAELISLKNLGD